MFKRTGMFSSRGDRAGSSCTTPRRRPLRALRLPLGLALGLVVALDAGANSSTDIYNHITYSAPNAYNYTTTLLDFTYLSGSPNPVVATHTGGTVNANRVSLSNSVVYNMSGGSANFTGYLVIACYSSGAVAATLNHSGGDLITPQIRMACFNGNSGNLNLSGGHISTGELRLEGPNSSRATVNLDGGQLTTSSIVRIGNDAFQSHARLFFNGGTLRAGNVDNPNWLALDNGHPYLNNITVTSISGGGAVFDTNGRSMGIGIRLSGAGGLSKRGTGTLRLGVDQSYTGSTQIEAGMLRLATVNGIAPSSVFLNGGALEFEGITTANLGSLGGSGNLVLQNTAGAAVSLGVGGNGASTTYAGGLSGSGALVKHGGGSLTLGSLNYHDGGTTVNGGTLTLAAANSAIGVGALRGALTINAGTTVVASAVDALGWADGQRITNISNSGGTFDSTAAGNNGWGVAYTLNGATVRSNGGVGSTSAASRLAFGGPAGGNTSVAVTGATPSTIAGHVDLRPDNGNASVNVTVAAGSRLNVPAGISSGGANVGISKQGAGVMALEFPGNTYQGATQVAAGTLLVNGSTGSGAVSVASGATLGGAGEVRGSTTVEGGGRVAPGNPLGTLTFSNGLTLSNGSVLELALGSSSDALRISGGSFTGSGAGGVTLQLSNSGGFSVPGSHTLIDFSGATPSGVDAGDFVLASSIAGPYDYRIVVDGSTVKLQVKMSDLTGPAVTRVDAPAAGTRRAGETIDLVVHLDEATLVNGAPSLPLTLDSGVVQAGYLSGSGSTALTFRHLVANGESDTNGIALAGPILANGGSLRDAAGNPASLGLNGIADLGLVRVDAVAPAVQAISLEGAPPAGSDSVRFTIRFTEAVNGVDAGDFRLAFPSGGAEARIAALAGSGRDYSLDIADIRGRGDLRVDLRSSGTSITDLVGSPIKAGHTGGDTFAADVERPVCHVDRAAQGDNSGTSWLDAYTDLRRALVADTRCRAVWITGGVYRADGPGFVISEPISLHGGFAGTESTLADRSAAVIAANPTVLSGDIDADDSTDASGIVVDASGISGDNLAVVVDFSSPSSSANSTLLDGLTITAADGHGLRCVATGGDEACDYRLTNVVFSGNRGDAGAALYNAAVNGGQANPTLDRVLFRGNLATQRASALFTSAVGTGSTANPLLDHAVFTANRGDSVVVNLADGGEAHPDFVHAVLVDNLPLTAAAAISNVSQAAGNAMLTLHNSVVWNNAGDPVSHSGAGSSAAFGHSVIAGSGGSSQWSGAGSDLGGNRDADPLLGPLGWHGGAIPGFLPRAGSAVIDAGAGCSGSDYRGVARPQGAACDIGATEVRQHALTVSVNGSGYVSTITPAIGDAFGACSRGGSPCTGVFAETTRVDFTSYAAPHARFTGWSGDCAADGRVVMDGAKQCAADFADNLLSVSLTRSSGTTPIAYGSALAFTATLTPTAPATMVPTGTVSFLVGSTVIGTADLVDGVATLQADALLAVGDHSLVARYDGDSHYLAERQPLSTALSQRITLAEAAVLFDGLTATYDGATHAITARIAAEGDAVCVVSPARVGPDAGSYPVSATCSGSNYRASGSATAVIVRASGSVEFTTHRFTYDGSTKVASARIAEEPATLCTLSPAAVGPDAGSYPVSASCSGNNYAASGTGTVSIDKAVGTVAFTTLDFTYDGAAKAVVARLEEAPPAECVVTPAMIGPDAGEYPLTASCSGSNHAAGGSATARIGKASQSIDVTPPGDRSLAEQPFVVAATASSGLPVTVVATTPTVCRSGGERGSTITLLAVGTCTLSASQDGDANHLPAPDRVLSFAVVEHRVPPRISAPAPQTVREDGVLVALPIQVEDAETAADALTVTASSDNAALIADSGLQIEGTGTQRLLRVVPRADASGSATITVSVTDADGMRANDAFTVTVLAVNDAPSLRLDGARTHAAGTVGMQTVPAFALATPGPANEALQTVTFTLEKLSDPQNIVAAASLTADGTLHYTLSGSGGSALFRVTARDDGGVANGGADSRSAEFRVLVGNGANLALRVYRRQPEALSLASARSKGMGLAEYVVELSNHGPDAVDGATLTVTAPTALRDVLWSCAAPDGSCLPASGEVPASGSRQITTSLVLAAGQTATLQLSGAVDASAAWIELVAQVRPPADTPSLGGGLQRVVFIEPSGLSAIHRSGFE